MAKAKVLGKLKGLIASAKEKSRNGRLYNEAFWDKKFDSDLFKEGLENKVFFGSLYHPDDNEEYTQIHCDDRSAVVLTDVTKKGLEYYGTFEILPTKAGQCLRNLLDIGCIFGISSRGLADYDAAVYDESMADNYDLITWDVVAFPGIKSCRLHEVGAVAESFSYGKKNKTKIMENLQNLGKSDSELNNYIQETLKAKESFDDQIQIEDIMAKYDIPSEYADFANVIAVNENNVPVFDDGEHGVKPITNLWGKVPVETTPGEQYLVNNVYYIDSNDTYSTGLDNDWLKLEVN